MVDANVIVSYTLIIVLYRVVVEMEAYHSPSIARQPESHIQEQRSPLRSEALSKAYLREMHPSRKVQRSLWQYTT